MGALQKTLGIEHPVIQGPFGGGISSVELAGAVSDAGGLGSFGAHILDPAAITELVAQLKQRTKMPFAVNLWVPQPGEEVPPTPAQWSEHVGRIKPYLEELGLPEPTEAPAPGHAFADQIDALLAAEPPVISFVMGVPDGAVVDEARRRGIVTIGTATTADEAVAIERAGLDVVVASGTDAGGHRGAFLRPVEDSLVGTFSLVPQVRDAVSLPVVAAGGIADRRGVRAALALGADGVQVGTGFLVTSESGASRAHQDVLLSEDAKVTVLTRLFSGRHARGIPNRLVRELAHAEALVPHYPWQGELMLPVRRASSAAGRSDLTNLWSGQAAPLVTARPAAEYLASLLE